MEINNLAQHRLELGRSGPIQGELARPQIVLEATTHTGQIAVGTHCVETETETETERERERGEEKTRRLPRPLRHQLTT